jgi:type I restriction enzyme R subunit
MDEDPALYQKFSIMIQEVIDDFRARRISELEYLRKAEDIAEAVRTKRRADAPESLIGKEDELAYFGVALPAFSASGKDDDSARSCAALAAIAAAESIKRHWKVRFWDDVDARKLVANDLDDFLFDIAKAKYGIELDGDAMDDLIEKVLAVAQRRLA